MNISTFKAAQGIDAETEIHYRHITSIKNTSGLHTHDFYEIFLILEGRVIHCINNEKHILEEGDLVFIRPQDFHHYEQLPGYDMQFINLSFYPKIIDGLFNYLGDGFTQKSILMAPMPPMVSLSVNEALYLLSRLEHINLIPSHEKAAIRTESRAIIAEIISKYFLYYKEDKQDKLPQWLNELCIQMKKKDNFTQGLSALLNISGRTHEHLCREFKKHLSVTPTEYINTLRLNYAENLLLNTDMDIITVCFNSGFDNLSYFYKLFKLRFNSTPFSYRRKNKREF
jgi:AraC family cel operon transcriptional repressor